MALTKDDIEAAIAQTSHQEEIRHSLSNYFEGLEQPVAVAFSITKDEQRNDINNDKINEIVDILRANGIDAVSMLDKEAAQPDKYVVNGSGIQTPFLSPEDALKATCYIQDVIRNNDFKISGYANLQTNETLLYASSCNAINGERVLDIQKAHPNIEHFDSIVAENGSNIDDFIDKMVSSAVENSNIIDEKSEYTENLLQGYEHLWRGATLGGKPYAAIFPSNDRKVAYASPNITIASGYTGYGLTMSGIGGATYPKTKSGHGYGFLYKFKSIGDEQIYYPDTGLQAAKSGVKGGTKEDVKGDAYNTNDFETAILPHKNKLEAIYLHVGKYDNKGQEVSGYTPVIDKLYKIELDDTGQPKDKCWKDFLALHEPTDGSVYGYLAERQNTQKNEQTQNPSNCYKFEIKENLPNKNYEKENFSCLQCVRTFVHDGDIKNTEDKIIITQDIKIMQNLKGLNLSDAHVDGKVVCAALPRPVMDELLQNLDNIPTSKNGMYCFDFNGNLDNETMESFLSKVKGTEWVEKYTHKAEDGHLIIDGEPTEKGKELNFCQIYPNRAFLGIPMNSCTVKPKTLPKDICDVEFGCKVEDIGALIDEFETLKKSKEKDTIYIKFSQKLDLSHFAAERIELTGHTNIEKFPPNISSVLYSDIDGMKNSEMATLPNSINSFSMKNISNTEKLDFGHLTLPNIWFENSQITEITNISAEYIEIKNSTLKFSGAPTCEQLLAINWSVEEGATIDLSHCKRIDLYDVDFSKAGKVILPEKGIVVIGENVKFPPDYKLDLSKCERGYVHHSVECAEVKLPKILSTQQEKYICPKQVKEISTSQFALCVGIEIPSHVKIIDSIDKYGMKTKLSVLKNRGLSQEQIKVLRKERLLAPVKKLINKFKQEKPKISKTQPESKKVLPPKLAELSGRTTPSQSVARSEVNTPQQTIQPPVQQNQTEQQTAPQTTASVKNMTSQEKGSFLSKLRRGFNPLLQAIRKPARVIEQTNVQAQTNSATMRQFAEKQGGR